MIFLQLAITCLLVNYVSGQTVKSFIRHAAVAQISGVEIPPAPKTTILISAASYYGAFIFGFAFVWSLPAWF